MRGVDIRLSGDRTMGAANAYRELGPLAGVPVGLADVGKGVSSVALAGQLVGTTQAAMVAGATSVVGHNWPFFLQFQGGRGAATSLGIGTLAPLTFIAAYLTRSILIGFTSPTLPCGSWPC